MSENGKTILIVDDDDDLRELLTMALEKAGYRVHSVVNTSLAKKWLDGENRADLILLDVMMPDGNGLDFCRWVRGQSALQRTPIIMSSGLQDEETLQDALEIGADDFIRKPVNVEALKEKIARAIAKSARA